MTAPNRDSARSWRAGTIDFWHRHFVFAATVLALVVYALFYLERGCHPIRGDGAGYWAYLPSLILYQDPSMETDAVRHYGGEFPPWTVISRYAPTGRYVNAYGMGAAVMMLPFFLAAHVVTLFFQTPLPWQSFGHPADGYSFFYQHAAGLAGMFYALAGLALLKRLLDRYFTKGISLAALAAIFLGTNLLHYTSGETVMHHPYSFFLFNAFLCALPGWYEKPAGAGRTILLGILAGLLILVRPPQILMLIFFPLFGVRTWPGLKARGVFLFRHARSLILMSAAALLVLLPQMLFWHYATGQWIINGYQAACQQLLPGVTLLDWGQPRILEVLFSLQRGLFFWSPVLLFSAAGLAALRKRAPDYFLPAIPYLALQLYLLSCWFQWFLGASFGYRGFVEAYGVLALCLASFFAELRSAAARWMVGGLTVACVGWSLFLMALFYSQEYSAYGLDRQALFDIFWWRFQAFKALWP